MEPVRLRARARERERERVTGRITTLREREREGGRESGINRHKGSGRQRRTDGPHTDTQSHRQVFVFPRSLNQSTLSEQLVGVHSEGGSGSQ
jgi:hypothetical protein